MTFDSGGGGGANPGLVPLLSVTASGDAAAAFDQGNIDATYRIYQIDYSNVTPGTNSQTMKAQVSTDGGSNWKGGTDYKYSGENRKDAGAQNTWGSTGDNGVQMSNPGILGNTGTESVNGYIRVITPADASTVTQFLGESTLLSDEPAYYHGSHGGMYTTAETVDAVRFRMNSGNINGTFDLYGVRTP